MLLRDVFSRSFHTITGMKLDDQAILDEVLTAQPEDEVEGRTRDRKGRWDSVSTLRTESHSSMTTSSDVSAP